MVASQPTTAIDPANRQRSPRYPAFTLREALARIEKLMEEERGATVPVTVALKHWDLSANSSSGKRCIATMLSYGLLDEEGTGKAKRVRISATGRVLARHPDRASAEYRSALRTAALSPPIHQQIFDRYRSQAGLPSRDTLAWDLERDFGFHPSAVDPFIAELQETLAFARVFDSGTLPEQSEDRGSSISPGDFIQWTSGGADQFKTPRRVARVADGFLFVDGSETGIPEAQARIEAAPGDPKKPIAPPAIQEKPGMDNEIFSLSEGNVTLQWPATLSQKSLKHFQAWLKIIDAKAEDKVSEALPQIPTEGS